MLAEWSSFVHLWQEKSLEESHGGRCSASFSAPGVVERAATPDGGRLTSRSCFEPQLAETEHVRYVGKPAKHLQCRPATLTKARCHAHGNKFEDLTAPGRIFAAKPAEAKHVRQVSKLAKHFQSRPAAVAEARRHAHRDEFGEPAGWKMVGSGSDTISLHKQVVHAGHSEVCDLRRS